MIRAGYRDQPLYARTLGLRHVTPSGFLCFVFLEGSVALGFLLALAELVSWWGVLVLPITVAVMVKLNDVVAGALTKPASPQTQPQPRPQVPRQGDFALGDRALSRARTVDLQRPDRPDLRPTVDLRGAARTVDLRRPNRAVTGRRATDGVAVARSRTDELELREQRARQSAARRYQ
jgi:hypothetical protein